VSHDQIRKIWSITPPSSSNTDEIQTGHDGVGWNQPLGQVGQCRCAVFGQNLLWAKFAVSHSQRFLMGIGFWA